MLRYHNLYHDLLNIVIIIVAGRGRMTAWRVLGHAIQNLVVPGDSIRGGDYARRGLLTRRTAQAVAAHLGVEIRKGRDRRWRRGRDSGRNLRALLLHLFLGLTQLQTIQTTKFRILLALVGYTGRPSRRVVHEF